MLTRWTDLGTFGRLARDHGDSLDALRREMNRLFFDFEREWPAFDAAPTGRAFPRASLEDSGAAFVLRVELPGVAEKDLEVNADANTVSVKGERADVVPDGYSVHRKERGAFRFARSFALPAKVEAEKVEAVLKHGVLTVTLPKAKEAQPQKVQVRAG